MAKQRLQTQQSHNVAIRRLVTQQLGQLRQGRKHGVRTACHSNSALVRYARARAMLRLECLSPQECAHSAELWCCWVLTSWMKWVGSIVQSVS